MLDIYLSLFLIGLVLVVMAWYRGRKETNKKYSRLSYLSLGMSALLLVALYVLPSVTQQWIISTIMIAIFAGSPIAFVLSITALFKKNEKILLALFGLFFSLLLIGVLIIFIIIKVSYSP